MREFADASALDVRPVVDGSDVGKEKWRHHRPIARTAFNFDGVPSFEERQRSWERLR